MSDIFISYAREDLDRARPLASALESRGWSVWWDRRIVAGETFDQTIERELESAKSVVVLWSKDSIESEWTKNEATVAAERNVLVPALLDDVRIPLEFRRKQTANLIDWDGDASHEGFQALCEGIAGRIGAPQLPRRLTFFRRRLLVVGGRLRPDGGPGPLRLPLPSPRRPPVRSGGRATAPINQELPRHATRQQSRQRRPPLRVDWTLRRRPLAPDRRRTRTASTIRRRSPWASSTS